MKQFLALSLCVGLFLPLTGCDFIEGGDTVSLPVSSVRVGDLPLRDRGEDWDADSDPDIVVEIQDASGRAIHRTAVQHDVDLSSGFLTYEIPQLTVNSATMALYVVVYETDGDRFYDALMRTSQAFRVSELEGVEVITLSDVGDRSFVAEVWTTPFAE